MSIPNIISIIRILLVPIFCVIYFTPGMKTVALIVLIVSGLSDLVDGYIARKFNQITDLGKVLDPIADKLFHMSTIACLCIDRVVGYWLLFIVMAKELFMICGGVILYKKTKAVIASKWYGKLSSSLFFSAFVLSFVPVNNTAYTIFISCLFAVAVLISLYAMINYVTKAVSINNARKRAERESLKNKAVK
ncbi:MAG: CDP-alcohol phosphatidyltransferase family protein [Ruminococcaceae bacterium]|nr:CDP-alcohol phosphatidyltransferase family protein [Oscillospiraceae bacterium]